MSEALTPALADEFLGFDVAEIVTLYTLNATSLGGGVSSFADRAVDGAAPVFDGITYAPVPVTTEGWEWSGAGAPPEVTMRIGVADLALGSAAQLLLAQLESLDDLIGAEITRRKTLARYLDGAVEADPQQHFGFESMRIEQKTSQTREAVVWRLKSALDQEGAMIPARKCTERCSHIYRVATSSGGPFDYSQTTCPYNAAAMFDLQGAPTSDATQDRCGKLLRHCRARFGQNARLPYRGFPGVGRGITR